VVAAGAILASPVQVFGDDNGPAQPSFFQATATGAGVSYTHYKNPNPLPVGLGPFVNFRVPDVLGKLTTSESLARGSIAYPGDLVAGYRGLLCLSAGAPAVCDLPNFPTVAQADVPGGEAEQKAETHVDLRDTDGAARIGAGKAEARAEQSDSASQATLGSWELLPVPGHAATIVKDLSDLFSAIPGVETVGSSLPLVSVGGGHTEQHTFLQKDGAVRSVATSVLEDVHLLGGAVVIGTMKVTAQAVSDGAAINDASSTWTYSDVTAGGFPATIDETGIHLQGVSDDGEVNSVADVVAQAISVAVDKLHMTFQPGGTSKTVEVGNTSAAASGLVVSFVNRQLTDTSPPQLPPALCRPVEDARGKVPPVGVPPPPLGDPAIYVPVPPLCAVPDLTGTADDYTIELGSAAALLHAEPTFADIGEDLGGVGTGDVDLTGSSSPDSLDLGDGVTVSAGGGSLGGVGRSFAGGRLVTRRAGPRSVAAQLFEEARFLGAAAGPVKSLYLALALMSVGLALGSRSITRRLTGTRAPRRQGDRS
jgi:hypothetical protein